ncbi:MAG: uracil phosphoribosyltransferase [Oscillospiraceae bacterium]|nr:uracil phosphoribosyltransferase [Oscillospiraceae bacterium]
MNKVTIIEHPLVQHKISLLRDINTGSKEFRELVSETAMLMCYEATRDLSLKTVEVQTPVAIAKTKVISGRKLAFVPILRAGLGMVDGAVKLVPAAKIGHVGMFRDPDTKEAVQYYCKLPFDIAERDVIITDIMLATGGTAVKTIEILKNANAKSIKMMCIIASPEGIEAVHSVYPDVEIYCGSVDEKLDERFYIVPGLGDAGDRIFGTK